MGFATVAWRNTRAETVREDLIGVAAGNAIVRLFPDKNVLTQEDIPLLERHGEDQLVSWIKEHGSILVAIDIG